MNILFLSLGSFNSYEQDNIYADILRCAIKEGHSNFIRKGISTLRLGGIYKRAIKKYCGHSVDIILYSTPPITLYKAIKYAKKSTGAKTYLLLKDIFPQNRKKILRHFRQNRLYERKKRTILVAAQRFYFAR